MTQFKMFNIKLRKELWVFLKKKAAEEDTSMANIIETTFEKMKEKEEKKHLTCKNTNV